MSVRAERDLLFVWLSIAVFLCEWSKFTWFWYAGNRSLGFSANIEIDLVPVWVLEIDLISVWGIDPL